MHSWKSADMGSDMWLDVNRQKSISISWIMMKDPDRAPLKQVLGGQGAQGA